MLLTKSVKELAQSRLARDLDFAGTLARKHRYDARWRREHRQSDPALHSAAGRH